MMTALALLAMVLTMLGTGLGLHGRDFSRIRTAPAVILIGLALQALLFPMAMALLVHGLLPASDLSFGLALVALAPATAASHVFVGLAGGNIGIARSLTAWSSLTFLAIVWAADLSELLPNLGLVLGLGYVLPLLAGMAVLALRPQLAIRAERAVFMAGSVVTGLAILGSLWMHWHPSLLHQFALSLVVAVIAGLFGSVAGGMGGATRGTGEAVGISLAMQNVAVMLGIFWAAGSGWFAASAGIYAIAMYLAVFGLLIFWRRVD